MDEIDASADLRAAWAAMSAPKHWLERYVKHAKALLCDHADGNVWSQPLGDELEIVATANTDLRIGAKVTFRLLSHGRRLGGFPLGVVVEGESKSKFLHTDANGDVLLQIDRHGAWMLRATRLQKSGTPHVSWESHFATFSFNVP